MQNRVKFWLIHISAAMVCLFGANLLVAAQDLPEFQKLPVTLKASEQVPEKILTGPNYRIETNVNNDGLINIRKVRSVRPSDMLQPNENLPTNTVSIPTPAMNRFRIN